MQSFQALIGRRSVDQVRTMSGGLMCMVYYLVKTYAATVDYARDHLIMIYGT